MIMATRKRHSPEQVVRKLTTADRLLAEGKDVATVCRGLGVSDRPITRWRDQFGELKADDAKRLKDLERENSTLKRLLADARTGEGHAQGDCAGKLLSPGATPGCRASPDDDAGAVRAVRLPGHRPAALDPATKRPSRVQRSPR